MSEQYTKRVEELLNKLHKADPAAQARHYAEVFSQLMMYTHFVEFVRDNFIVEYLIDQETGALGVQVSPIEAADIDGPEADFASAFGSMTGKDEADKL